MPLPADQVLHEDDLAALRRAAALVHTVGRLRVDVTTSGMVRVRVDASAARASIHPSHDARVVDACGFRLAVVQAWRDHQAGRDVTLIGGLGPVDLVWRVPPPGAELGLGAIRTTCGGRFVWAFASLLAPHELAAVLAEIDTAEFTPDTHPELGADAVTARLAPDDLLGATVVHVDAVPTDLGTVRAIDEVMRGLLAVVIAAECVSDLTDARP